MKRDDPIIVLGTAGTGTRVISNILESGGVFMGLRRNPERDNLDFIHGIKNGIPLVDCVQPQANSYLKQTGSPNFEINQLDPQMIKHVDALINEFINILIGDVPNECEHWGWKESQSMFVLPFLKKYFPRLKVIHVVRDGRDIAFSQQQCAKFQVAYVQCLTGISQVTTCDDEWAISVAKAWSINNIAVNKWADQNMESSSYFVIRLEDLKNDPVTLSSHIYSRMGMNIQEVAERVRESGFDAGSLRLGKYKNKNSSIVKKIEEASSEALRMFGYL